jgi:hypothetical protein
MTERLKQAVEQAAAVLPPQGQDQLADVLSLLTQEDHALDLFLAALDEFKWDVALANSQDKLERLANRALQAYEAGEVEPLDLNKL